GSLGGAFTPMILSSATSLTARAAGGVSIRDLAVTGAVSLSGAMDADGVAITNGAATIYNLEAASSVFRSTTGTPSDNAIDAPTVVLYSVTGSVGSTSTPVLLNSASSESLTAKADGGGKSVFIQDITAGASVTLINGTSAGGTSILNGANATYSLQADGDIASAQTAPLVNQAIAAPVVALYSTSGDVGTASQPVLLARSAIVQLTAQADAGSVRILVSGDLTISLASAPAAGGAGI